MISSFYSRTQQPMDVPHFSSFITMGSCCFPASLSLGCSLLWQMSRLCCAQTLAKVYFLHSLGSFQSCWAQAWLSLPSARPLEVSLGRPRVLRIAALLLVVFFSFYPCFVCVYVVPRVFLSVLGSVDPRVSGHTCLLSFVCTNLICILQAHCVAVGCSVRVSGNGQCIVLPIPRVVPGLGLIFLCVVFMGRERPRSGLLQQEKDPTSPPFRHCTKLGRE